MKKYILILVVGIMSGCASNQTLIKHSDVVITSGTGKVYICNCDIGRTIYEHFWNDSTNSKRAELTDSAEFEMLKQKSTPCNCNKGHITKN
jgi:hypothetical protein